MTSGDRPKLIVILGPTAVGKSALALELAQAYDGEIISADSMQVYRQMDIGTAKPSREDRARIPHHLIDVVDPDEPFNAALFVEQAVQVIDRLHRLGKPVFVVGGTGLYIRALLGGLLGSPGPDEVLRAQWKTVRDEKGVHHLHEQLRRLDPRAAGRIHPHDAVRIVRALEVLALTGESIVGKQAEHRFAERRFRSLKIGLRLEREPLFARIEARVDAMLAAGLVDEVAGLVARGYDASLKPMQSLGYRHIGGYLRGEGDLADAIRRLKRDTRHYAKRQQTWFATDPEIRWFSPGDTAGVEARLRPFLNRESP